MYSHSNWDGSRNHRSDHDHPRCVMGRYPHREMGDLLVLGAAQAASNLMYVLADANEPSDGLMYSASVVESCCGGLGTSLFLAFLMSICNKSFAAVQYAVLSAWFGLTRVVAGSFSGMAADQFGSTTDFAMNFVLPFRPSPFFPLSHDGCLIRLSKDASA